MPCERAPTSKTTCIVVLNWNNPLDTLGCLESLLTPARRDGAVIVCCDNASSDDSVERIAHWARRSFAPLDAASGPAAEFFLLRTTSNLGYAGGNNAALSFVLGFGRFHNFWLLNNDTVVEPEALRALLDCAQASGGDVGLLGSTIVDHDSPQTVQCAGGFRYHPTLTITRKLLGGRRLAQALTLPKEPRLDCVSGASMFIRAAVVKDVGLLCEDYFLYCEELDYAIRLKANGYTMGWCRHSVVRHHGGATTGSRSATNTGGSWQSNYHENLSALRFTAKHYPLLLPLAGGFRFVVKLVTVVLFRRWSTVRPLLRAYWDFLSGKDQPAAEKAEQNVQVHFVGAWKD